VSTPDTSSRNPPQEQIQDDSLPRYLNDLGNIAGQLYNLTKTNLFTSENTTGEIKATADEIIWEHPVIEKGEEIARIRISTHRYKFGKSFPTQASLSVTDKRNITTQTVIIPLESSDGTTWRLPTNQNTPSRRDAHEDPVVVDQSELHKHIAFARHHLLSELDNQLNAMS
jgi:hypothetical protein